MKINSHDDFKRVIYTFQGGGALGAYQAGVFQGLTESGHYEPNWIIGTSIGAFNAGIIAGNPPKKRVEKLHQFWNSITSDLIPCINNLPMMRKFHNFLSAEQSIYLGINDFFYPNINNPFFAYNSSPDNISFYVTEPLKKLLAQFIDFDYINHGKIRLTLGVVEVQHGKACFFDNQDQTITIDHILASGALPPGFPSVKIEGKYYWDGGIFNNSPFTALLNEPVNKKTICFVNNVFDSFGLLPKSLDDVLKRHKDIIYSSHFRSNIDIYKIVHGLRYILSHLSQHIPDKLKKNPELQDLMHLQEKIAPIHFVRFLYQSPEYELSSKDYDFSRISMEEKLTNGYDDAKKALKEVPWLTEDNKETGIHVHEFYRDLEKLKTIHKDY
ncbi:transmembrane protein [Legionella sainthelensi]|uniref:patatin-like phospholipase family protein n=1 Tax=Legionella sainthelensi TaxID=28087 RepID=UPI000E20737F|nr:patatin-like phospholipase family protein [Legionella sainthelensi]VEB36762.1 transmembrane protein [Legionella sainthelensi]